MRVTTTITTTEHDLVLEPGSNLIGDTICRTAELGLTITDPADAGTVTLMYARPVAVENSCPSCRQPGRLRDHDTRQLVGFPTRLRVQVPRFACDNSSCTRKIFQASLPCAKDGAKLTHRVTR